ncbi:hypothetical protein [Pseudoalteromonas byunsanensis]|uniref:Uncharacterized protein n=1 Tax=Pseudoalteromonas byunsanensis TaxID=327939 RepID=A0A1S1N3R4_9GAMM|nr:hypothetical protein [Pseudoalteromonas byunsanensis]OHU94024.1 hypothetical protein BIW53_17545 [Pseudoalteromonas byunsanensis]
MIAVLTGDLVNSSKMLNEIHTDAITTIQGLLQSINEQHGATGEIYRGDEFQIQFPNAIHAITCTILIKLALHFKTRSDKPVLCTLSLAYGEQPLSGKQPTISTGPVFIESGRGLANTPRGEISVSFGHNNTSEMRLLTQFLSHQLNKLTKTQAELLYIYITNHFAEHQKIAEITKTSRQNISNRLSSIGATLIRDYIAVINQRVTKAKGKDDGLTTTVN